MSEYDLIQKISNLANRIDDLGGDIQKLTQAIDRLSNKIR